MTSQVAPPETVLANYFRIGINQLVPLLKYTIDVASNFGNNAQGEPRKLSRETKRYLIHQLLTDQTNGPVHDNWACDYKATVISVSPLYVECDEQNPVVQRTYLRTIQQPQDGSPRVMGNAQATITCNGRVDLAGLDRYVRSRQFQFIPDPIPDTLEALNIISWKQIHVPSFLGGVAGNRFYPGDHNLNAEDENQERDNRLFLIRRGFCTSMRPGFDSVFLNVHTCTSAFYSPIFLHDWMELMWPSRRPRLTEFQRQLANVRVQIASQDRLTARTWRIFGIDPVDVSQKWFTDHATGLQHNVHTYLSNQYGGIQATSHCINVGNGTNQIWFAADQLKICDWQILSKTLDNGPYKDRMVNFGSIDPQENKRLILRATQSQLGFGQLFYANFGITPTGTFTPVMATHFTLPTVLYGPGVSRSISDASWNLRGVQEFHRGAKRRTHVGVLTVNANINERVGDHLLRDLRRYGVINGNGNELRFGHAILNTGATGPGTTNFRTTCTASFTTAYNTIRAETGNYSVDILLVVLGPAGQDYYAEIKRWGDCVVGIPTICVMQSNWNRLNHAGGAAFRANICVKFNAKLGGVNHRIEANRLQGDRNGLAGTPDDTMILGADVTHPGKQSEESCPSLAAVVATDAHGSSNYLASARVQPGRQEFISGLASMIRERFSVWARKAFADGKPGNRLLPKMLLFYRDGVSDSQYDMVVNRELPQIQAGCRIALENLQANNSALYQKAMGDALPDSFRCEIIIIIAAKRHHTRFYPQDDQQAGNLTAGKSFSAPFLPPTYQTFYLQSHDSPLGTARSSYYVIVRGNALSLVQLRRITNQLCFTGARCTRGLSIATPARYADHVCDRLRHYMRPAMHRNYRYQFTLPPSTVPPNQGAPQPPSPADYARDTRLWRQNLNRGPDENPWHTNLDNTMFYI